MARRGGRGRGALLALLLAGAGLGGCSWLGVSSGPPAPAKDAKGGVYHVVEPGQTLWKISRAYGVDVEEIAVLNGIGNPDRLLAGKRLFIPRAARALAVPARGGPAAPKERPRWAEAVEPPKRGGPPRRASVRFEWPAEGKVLHRFGSQNGMKYDGIVIGAPPEAPVRATAPGQVIFSDWGPGGYGRTIIIRHAEGEFHSIYAHNAENLVKKGDVVEGGRLIARVGRTGNVDQAQLHFEIRHRTVPQDPLSYLP
ncbi:MAG: peptidoglycan DD-metalloendopeptidase family protein [Nitrospinota bacterium]